MVKDSIKTNYVVFAHKKGYKSDCYGNVWSPKNKKLKLYLKSKKEKYYCFGVRENGIKKSVCVHQFIAFEKFGNKVFDEKIAVRHLNGNSLDNSYNNIQIGTYSDNILDIDKKIRIEKAIYASFFIKKYNHEEIIKFYNETKSYKKTMDKFGIKSKNGLYFILHKKE